MASIPRDQLQRLVDGQIDAAVVIDPSRRPVVWNRAYVQLVGLRPRRFLQLVTEESVRCCELFEMSICATNCLLDQTFVAGRPARMDEIRCHAPLSGDTAEQTVIVSATPLESERGELAAVLEVYRDVTAEVRVQERYKILLDRERRRAELLEEQVAARTADLSASLMELERARDRLVAAEKLSSLGRLAAGLAHEINNPINFVYGNSEFLLEYGAAFERLIAAYESVTLSPEDVARLEALQRELEFDYVREDFGRVLAAIREGAERAAQIVQSLRVFIHGGSEPARAIPVDLDRCIRSTLNLVAHEVSGRVELDYRPSEPALRVLGNETQLHQVLMNLIMNGIQAIGEQGKIEISVAAHEGGVRISVADTGCGIAEEDLVRVFDPFFTTKPVGLGTGLGLSISYSLVEAHGGRLTMDSEVGHGTTAHVWLPAAAGEQPA